MDELNFKASEKAIAFFEEYLPEALKAENSYQALKMLYELIDDKGFEPPKYDKLNDFGIEADEIYDELYLLNQPEE